jgi:hypothetical protein
MTKSKLKAQIREAIYAGNIGIHELMAFYGSADSETVDTVDNMFKSDNADQAWHTVKDYLRSRNQLTTFVNERKKK